MSVLTAECMLQLQKETGILHFIRFMKNRDCRMCMEAIFSLTCLFTLKRLPGALQGVWLPDYEYQGVDHCYSFTVNSLQDKYSIKHLCSR